MKRKMNKQEAFKLMMFFDTVASLCEELMNKGNKAFRADQVNNAITTLDGFRKGCAVNSDGNELKDFYDWAISRLENILNSDGDDEVIINNATPVHMAIKEGVLKNNFQFYKTLEPV